MSPAMEWITTHASTLHSRAAWQLGPMQPVNIAPSASRAKDYDLQITQGHATCRLILSSSGIHIFWSSMIIVSGTTCTTGVSSPNTSRTRIIFSPPRIPHKSLTSFSMGFSTTLALLQSMRALHRDGWGSLEPPFVATLHGCSGARVSPGSATPKMEKKNVARHFAKPNKAHKL